MAKQIHWNKKVASKRGPQWRKNLSNGRKAVRANPTKLRTGRLGKEKSQLQVAKAVNMTSSTYCQVESGHRTVGAPQAAKIAKHLGLDLKRVFKRAKIAGKVCPDRLVAAH